ncbi:MAG TPA: thymidylate kinase, partial [Xanthobacteraceae bacterium]|nr:thymidylate kinase [Xanthobacteraceae bacterium]
LEFHVQLREAFRDAVEAEPSRCVLIDASQSPEVVATDIWMTVVDRLMKQRAAPLASWNAR